MSHHHALPLPGLFLRPCEAQGISQQGGRGALPQDPRGFGGQCSQNPQASGRQHQHLHFPKEEAERTGAKAQAKSSRPQRRSSLQPSLLWAAEHQS